MHKFAAERPFEVWWYRASHSQLLLRSSKFLEDVPDVQRTDIWFKGVDALVLQATAFSGELQIVRLHDPELHLQHVGIRPQAAQFSTLFALDSAEGRSLVVAGAVFVAEDTGSLFGPTFWEREAGQRANTSNE